jgi:hypothetical protein
LRRLLVASSLSSSLALACGPGEAPRLETEHLSFHGELGEACEGLGRLYEREVDRIEHGLGGELREPVDVYLGIDEVERRCPAGTAERDVRVAGCVVSDTEIAASMDALSQQLVRVIRDQHDVLGVPFIEGALPYMLGLGRPSSGYMAHVFHPSDPEYDIAAQLAYGWPDESLVSRELGAHFLHWVEQAYGSPAFHAWLWSDAMREGSDLATAFAAATGQSIDLARDRWGDESELDAAFHGSCHGLPAPPLPAAGLHVQASACCNDPSVEQMFPPLLDVGQRCFTLPADTEVTVELLAGEGTLVLRADGCSPTSPHFPTEVELGEAATFTMTACRWNVVVIGPERCEPGQEVRYAITPS